MKQPNKSVQVAVRFTPSEKRTLTRAASRSGETVAQFVRRAVERLMAETLAKRGTPEAA